VFDPDTSAFLGSQTILRTPAAGAPAAAPGTRLGFGALVTSGWVHKLPR
jgi:S1-C subfamily serine protease